MSFEIQVTRPYAASDQHDTRTECESLGSLAEQIDEATRIGVWASLEVAADVARGEDYSEEFEDGCVLVTARVVEAAVA